MTASSSDWITARRACVARASAAVVGIEPSRPRGRGFSGIVWNGDSVVTAAEGLHGAESVSVRTADGLLDADIVASDLSVDVAVLRAQTGLTGIAAAEASALRAGDDLLVAGVSRGLPRVTWTHAEQVGPAWRSRSGGELARWIRLAPGLDPGLEGGGVFDLEGRLCAMAVSGPRRQILGIPVETIGRIVVTVLSLGRLPQPYLGVRLQPVPLDASLRERLSRRRHDAVMVVGVEADSPAAAAGILFGDLVLSLDGASLESATDLKAAVARAPIAAPLRLQLLRAGVIVESLVTIRERARDGTP